MQRSSLLTVAMVLKLVSSVLWIIVLTAQPAAGIVNSKRNSTPQFHPRREYFKKKSYLEADRPLWVLEDKVARPGEIEVGTHRPFKSKRRFIAPSQMQPKLPSHYSNLNSIALRQQSSQSLPRDRKRIQNSRIFPVFDDFESHSDPILIYRGPKAEMIFNTMMTSRKYPMQEPVPGQVMYPPYSPKFKPTPVVERVRTSKYPESVFHNVTLVPFYAHEAVDPRQLNYEPITSETSVQPVSEEPHDNHVESYKYLTDEEDTEPACYNSYYSQDDVQTKYWSLPYTTPTPSKSITQMDLNRQLALPSGIYSNHRMEATTTPMPRPAEDQFRIMYESDYENAPQKRHRMVHSAKYGGFKTMYPIYTLNKLLKYKPQKEEPHQFARRAVDIADRKRKASEETWLIWDSRHKGTHSSNYLNPMSSKILTKNHKTAAALETKILVQNK